MNWNHLQYVLAIAQHRSITKAAQALYLSQPSLSLSLKGLEKELGVSLFRRQGGGLELTYAGQLYCDWASSVLHSHRQLTQKLRDISDDRRRLIRLGISPHRSALLLPDIAQSFYERCPDCQLQVAERPTYELKAELEQGGLELIVDTPHPDTLNYQNELLAHERIILAVPSVFAARLSPELRRGGALPLRALQDFPFVLMPDDHVIGRMCRRMCENAAFYPNERLTCSNVESALRMAQRQLGVAFVPEIFAARKPLPGEVEYHPAQELEETREICLVFSKGLYLHQPMQVLMGLFREVAASIYVR